MSSRLPPPPPRRSNDSRPNSPLPPTSAGTASADEARGRSSSEATPRTASRLGNNYDPSTPTMSSYAQQQQSSNNNARRVNKPSLSSSAGGDGPSTNGSTGGAPNGGYGMAGSSNPNYGANQHLAVRSGSRAEMYPRDMATSPVPSMSTSSEEMLLLLNGLEMAKLVVPVPLIFHALSR
ncbi:hypothetical protein DL93DRAFT_2073662 [Clavulina sp. PMI_390]|nr:hypothetical protein DL93DRAFT_2073662 [Clavulina sp. PMI_390]